LKALLPQFKYYVLRFRKNW